MFEPPTHISDQFFIRTVGLYYKMSVSNNYIIKNRFFSSMNNSNTYIGHNLSYLKYKFNCSILEFNYKYYMGH